MKYILNETPIKTTKGFNMNNVKVDLDLPNVGSFHEYKYNKIENVDIKESINNSYSSRIGLSHDLYKNLDIYVSKEKVINNLLEIKYEFGNDEHLIDKININVDENSKLDLFINYESINNNINYHNGNINISLNQNSNMNLIILNKLNKNSINMISSTIEALDNSKVKITLLDLNGSVRLYNFESNTSVNSESILNNIYIGKNNDLIDMNYNYINNSESSISNIEVQGVLLDKSKKAFKGIIDFKTGSNNSIGKENENCLLLSDEAISKSLPMLLCSEENVEGAHSVSSGKIDENKLFYLTSRGISLEDAKKLIILSNFEIIINDLPDSIKENVHNIINELI